MTPINPATVLMVGGLFIAASPASLRRVLCVCVPLVALWQLLILPTGTSTQVQLFDYTLQPLRVDSLSYIFALIFIIAAILAASRSFLNPCSLGRVAGTRARQANANIKEDS